MNLFFSFNYIIIYYLLSGLLAQQQQQYPRHQQQQQQQQQVPQQQQQVAPPPQIAYSFPAPSSAAALEAYQMIISNCWVSNRQIQKFIENQVQTGYIAIWHANAWVPSPKTHFSFVYNSYDDVILALFNNIGERWFCTLQFNDFSYEQFAIRCAPNNDAYLYHRTICPG